MKELLTNEAFVWCVMPVIIFALTFAFKFPYKKFLTSRIKDEKKRKLANKLIVLFTLGLGIALNYFYCLWQGCAFSIIEFGDGLKYGLTAIALYSALEIKTDGAIENPFNNEDSQQVIEEITELVEKKPKEKKPKKKSKDTANETAEEKFWNLVGQDNED
jgi:hypothetical protein